MAAQATQFKNKQFPLIPLYNNGLMSLSETAASGFGNGDFGIRAAAYFAAGSGTTPVPDVTYNQSSAVTLVPQAAVPYGTRCYVTRFDVDVRGSTAWAGGTYMMLQDTNLAPLVYLPTCSLGGLASYIFPDSDQEYAIVATASSFAASTGVITLPASTLVSGAYSGNCCCTVIGGTGIGQSALIASNTAATITPTNGASAFPVALDSTSVIAVWYWAATGTPTTTTVPFSNGGFTSNSLDNGFNLIGVVGTSAGKPRPIASNTSTTPTVAYAYNTAPAAGDLMMISDNPPMFGAIDMCVSDKWAAAGTNQGLQVAIGGTFTAGSPARVYVEGFFAA